MSTFRRYMMGLYLQRQTPPVPVERCIEGYTYGTNKIVGVSINGTFTWNSGSSYNYTVGNTYTATSDSTGYYKIMIPEDLVIRQITMMGVENSPLQNNYDNIRTIDFSKLGNMGSCTTVMFMCADLNNLEEVRGLSVLKRSPILSLEGMFRSTTKLNSVDLSGVNTSNIKRGSSGAQARYGFPVMFYQSGIKTLVMPMMPKDAYFSGSTFQDCFNLSNLTFVGEIQGDIFIESSPLTLASVRSILSHLSSTHIEDPVMYVPDNSWDLALDDALAITLAKTAIDNGWILPEIPIYRDACTNRDKWYAPVGNYFYGFEKETDTYPNQLVMGKIYSIVKETSSTNPHSYGYYEFDKNGIDISESMSLSIQAKAFNYISSSGSTGITRSGYTTTNNNFKLYIQFVDVNGKVSPTQRVANKLNTTLNPQSVSESSQTLYTLYYSTNVTGIDLKKITGFRFAYIKETDSFSNRTKGCWFNYIKVY